MVKTKQSAQNNWTNNEMHSTDPPLVILNWKTKPSDMTGYLVTKGGRGGRQSCFAEFLGRDVSGSAQKELFPFKTACRLLGLRNSLSFASNSKQSPHFHRDRQWNKNGVVITFERKQYAGHGTQNGQQHGWCHLQAIKQVSQQRVYETSQATQILFKWYQLIVTQ